MKNRSLVVSLVPVNATSATILSLLSTSTPKQFFTTCSKVHLSTKCSVQIAKMANNPSQPLVDYEDDSDYASAEDHDFNPDATSKDDASDSEDDSAPAAQIESETKKPTKRKRAKVDNGDGQEAEDVGFENSGDEAIIGKGLKKAKRRKRKGEESEDEGGEGGFVRTRRMAALAYVLPLPTI